MQCSLSLNNQTCHRVNESQDCLAPDQHVMQATMTCPRLNADRPIAV